MSDTPQYKSDEAKATHQQGNQNHNGHNHSKH